MRTITCLVGGLLLWVSAAFGQRYLEVIEAGTYPLSEIQREAEAYFDVVGRGQGTGYKQYKRWEYVASLELDERGVKIPNHVLAEQARVYRRAAALQQQESGNFGGDWQSLGPTYWNRTTSWNPGVGRVTSIGIDLQNPEHLIVGSPTGGVWKTVDGGFTWAPLTDDFSTVDVYALEISPWDSNDYLWGSTSGRIYRSTDGGLTWKATSHVGGTGRVSRIQHHPTEPDVVYAVSESSGLFRSTNGGNTWAPVAGVSGMGGYDVEFKPGDPKVMYFSGTRLYRSNDGGTSWVQVAGFNTANNAYKMMAVTPAAPEVVYVLESKGNVFGGLYKSENSGMSFVQLIDGSTINYFGYSLTGDDDKGQAPRDMDIVVSPLDAEEVHIAGINTWKSVDGGLSFFPTSYWVYSSAVSQGLGYVHADVDIMKYLGHRLYVGTDGGIFISEDGGFSFVDYSTGLSIREFYRIGVSKTNPNVVVGGSQDNGTSAMRGPHREWVDWLGADGMEGFVDWSNENNLYGTSQSGSLYRSTNQGNTYTGISKPPGVEKGAWITPFEQDPKEPNTIYAAYGDIWKRTMGIGSWVKISDFNGENFNHLKIAPSDNQRMYAARQSQLFTTADGGATWTEISGPWTRGISFIAVHPREPERLVIVEPNAVYHSDDAGATWSNITSGLPSGTKYCAAWEDTGLNGLYVGGFGYVSYTNDDLEGKWIGFSNGLPTVRVYELEINYVSETIFACTYGRGLWESPIYNRASTGTSRLSEGIKVSLFPNPAQERVWLDIRTDQPLNSRLDLFAVDGRSVGTLFQGPWPSGHSVQSIALPLLPAGTYFYRLTTDAGTAQGRLFLK